MIWIAAVVEAVIGKYMDMGILLGIQATNASIAFYETTQSGNAVAALKASLRPEATVKRDGRWKAIDASLLVPGDLVLLSTGCAVPADCRVNHGTVDVDQSAITGESMSVSRYTGELCMMGSTVSRGEVEATVEATGPNTFFGKTAALLNVSNSNSYNNSNNDGDYYYYIYCVYCYCYCYYYECRMSVCHFPYLSVYLSINQYLYLSIYLSIYLSLYPIYLSTLSISLPYLSLYSIYLDRE